VRVAESQQLTGSPANDGTHSRAVGRLARSLHAIPDLHDDLLSMILLHDGLAEHGAIAIERVENPDRGDIADSPWIDFVRVIS
jgi:hypothetical protein